MHTISDEYKTAIVAKDRETYIAGTIKTRGGAIIPVTNSSIKQGSLYYTNQCTSDDGFSIGHTHMGKQGITIYDELTDYGAFQGAIIELAYYLKINETEYEGVPLGIFEVVEATRPTTTTIKLIGYDNMAKFDVDYPLDADDKYSMRTPFERLKDICVALGVELWKNDANVEFELGLMPNGAQKHVLVWSPEVVTARDYLDFLCQMLCGFATIDRQGRLRIVCWRLRGTMGGYAISSELRNTSLFNDTELKYSAVNMTVNFTEASDDVFLKNITAPAVPTGAGEVMSLYPNALIRGSLYNQAQTILDNIASVLTNADSENGTIMRWLPCTVQYAGDPALDLGDWLTHTGYTAGAGVTAPIHRIEWTYRGWQRLEAMGFNKQSTPENRAAQAKQAEQAQQVIALKTVVEDNLTSSNIETALSANMGRVLKASMPTPLAEADVRHIIKADK